MKKVLKLDLSLHEIFSEVSHWWFYSRL